MDLKDSEFVMRNIPYVVDTITFMYPRAEMFLDLSYDEYVNTEAAEKADDTIFDIMFLDDGIRFYIEGIDEEYFDSYVAELLVDDVTYDELLENNGAILFDEIVYADDSGEYIIDHLLKLQSGDTVKYLPTENYITGEKIESGEYNIMGRAVREYWLNEEEYYNLINIYLVMPKENMENLFGSSYLVQVHANADDEHIRDLGEWLNENSSRYDFAVTDNVEELFEQHDRNMIVFIGLLFVSIFIIITGTVCVYHIIVTGISERKADLKILNMVGMSSAQFRWMLLIEDVFYGLCSVVAGAALFIAFSSLSMFQSMGIKFDYSMTGIFMLISFLIITFTGAVSSASGIKTAA